MRVTSRALTVVDLIEAMKLSPAKLTGTAGAGGSCEDVQAAIQGRDVGEEALHICADIDRKDREAGQDVAPYDVHVVCRHSVKCGTP